MSWRRPLLSPLGLVSRAALVAGAYGLAHAAGLRAHTCILSGTSPTGNIADRGSVLWGCLYLLLHFAFVVGVPILVLAAGGMKLCERLERE